MGIALVNPHAPRHGRRILTMACARCSVLALFDQSKFIQNGIVLNDNLSSFQKDRADSRVHVDAIRSRWR
jgi:hypothetical protein